jgi:small conductance mechanosensitive channel
MALRATTGVLLWVVALLLALSQGGIDVGPLLAAFGVLGVALGIGGQHLARDLIGGVAIILEDQYRVGDVIKVNSVSGRVERVSLRSTTVRDVHGVSHVISNGDIRTSSNLTKGFSRYVIDIPIPYEENVDRVIDVAREQLEAMRQDREYADAIHGPLAVLGVDSYEESGVIAKVYVETAPGRQWSVGRELRRRIKAACDERGITIRVAS